MPKSCLSIFPANMLKKLIPTGGHPHPRRLEHEPEASLALHQEGLEDRGRHGRVPVQGREADDFEGSFPGPGFLYVNT